VNDEQTTVEYVTEDWLLERMKGTGWSYDVRLGGRPGFLLIPPVETDDPALRTPTNFFLPLDVLRAPGEGPHPGAKWERPETEEERSELRREQTIGDLRSILSSSRRIRERYEHRDPAEAFALASLLREIADHVERGIS
jgi:hypothetical protein